LKFSNLDAVTFGLVESIIAASLGIKQITGGDLAEPGHYNYLINDVESVRKPDREGGQVSIEAP
jgi:hypothetical protein